MTIKVCALGDFFLTPDIFPERLNKICGDQIELSVHKMDAGPMISGEHGDPIREYSGNEEQVIECAQGADALLVHIAPVSRRVIEALPNLKFLGVGRGGPVNVDKNAIAERNIVLTNAPGRNANAVAEFTIGAILNSSREITIGAMEMKNDVWSRVHYHYENTGLEISEMTVGLIGYSHIGKIVARLLNAFGAKIIFFDPYQEESDEDQKNDIKKVSLDALCRTSDVISLHPRLTNETESMCDDNFFSKLKAECLLVNTARGELIDQTALCRALDAGKLGAAFLDTFNPEPPLPNDPLIMHPKVFSTPHIAGASKTSAHNAVEMIARDLASWINDQK